MIYTDSANLGKLCSEDKEWCDTGGDRGDSQNKKSGVYMGVSAPVSETDLPLRCYVKLSGNRYLNVKLKTPHDRSIKKSLAHKFQVITGHGKANRKRVDR